MCHVRPWCWLYQLIFWTEHKIELITFPIKSILITWAKILERKNKLWSIKKFILALQYNYFSNYGPIKFDLIISSFNTRNNYSRGKSGVNKAVFSLIFYENQTSCSTQDDHPEPWSLQVGWSWSSSLICVLNEGQNTLKSIWRKRSYIPLELSFRTRRNM